VTADGGGPWNEATVPIPRKARASIRGSQVRRASREQRASSGRLGSRWRIDEIIHLGGRDIIRRRENAGKNAGAIAIECGDGAFLGTGDDRPGSGCRSRHRFVENEGSRQIAFFVEMPHSERDCYTSLIVSYDRIRPIKAREGETGRVGLRAGDAQKGKENYRCRDKQGRLLFEIRCMDGHREN
jgi:hypothetical protein